LPTSDRHACPHAADFASIVPGPRESEPAPVGQISLAERLEWDNYYIVHSSLSLDLRIMALTLISLFRNAE
jgi:lipopolysaccharide/colanic/teichoic acid biosynthesis glycosyltransferase